MALRMADRRRAGRHDVLMEMSDHTDTDSEHPPDEPVATFGPKDTITFGRDDSNDVMLADDWISPPHAEIRRRDEFVLVDLENTTGIHHNGQRVLTSTIIKVGDVFSIGRHNFKLG